MTKDKQILTLLSTPVVDLNPVSHMPDLVVAWVDIANISLNKSDWFLKTNSVSDNKYNVILKFLLALRKKVMIKAFGFKNPPSRVHKSCLPRVT